MSYIIFSIFLGVLSEVSSETYSVKIATESYVNIIDSKFLSFTIDPKYLFSTSEKYQSKECICMASSLTPAYIRIAGPSTAFLTFHNATISIEELDEAPREVHFHDSFADDFSREMRKERNSLEVFESRFKRNHEKIEVSHKEWRKFVQWAKSTGFDLVFALNNEEKVSSGMWDPNTALNILTVAEKANIQDIYWQLGYECRNQSIEEYLNDLETLGVIVETFAPGRAGQWKVVGGDVTPCLQADSKSDFKDYVTLSNDMMDAVLLNGNSSTQELERMSDRDRVKLLKLLSTSATPLWLTEAPWPSEDQVSRAADWLVGLGHAARNGFSHHFRELGDEMYQPSLSFYMALLFKNLVGSKVLDVDMEPEQAILFAHCTSLRQRPVPGALTLYGVNMDVEPARFSVKLDRRGEGGDIMQFILGHDSSGNIQVNGRPMYFEGDLKPVVKRVRPYKSLLLNLPARSFGFWVLANTKINACYDEEDNTDKEYEDDASVESEENETIKAKRSILQKDFDEYSNLLDVSVDFFDENDTNEIINNKNLINRMNDLNKDLNRVQELYKTKPKSDKRLKRHIDGETFREKIKKLRNRVLVLKRNRKSDLEPEGKASRVFPNILKLSKRNFTRYFNNNKLRKGSRLSKNNISKRNPKTAKTQQFGAKQEFIAKKKIQTTEKPTEIKTESNVRNRRHIDNDQVELSIENEIEVPKDSEKLWAILRKIHKQLKDLSEENDDYEENDSKASHHLINEEVIVNDTGFVKTTVRNLMSVLSDLNKNLNKFWNGIKLLD